MKYLPSENVQMIIKMCGFTLKNYILDIPKDIYLFARIYYKNKEEKQRITESWKQSRQITNLINNLHSQKKFEKVNWTYSYFKTVLTE